MDLNATDAMGNTEISWAARKGHGAILKILLVQEHITPGTVDKHGKTPLLWAAENGHEDLVKMLLEWEDVS